MRKLFLILILVLFLVACGGSGGGGDAEGENGDGGNTPQPTPSGVATVLAANDLGMHCMDKEFSVFSILPPFNVVLAQVVMRDADGRPYLAGDGEVSVFYDSVADAAGSENSYSIGKTDFWLYADALFGTTLQEGEGLTGLFMPGDAPQAGGARPMDYNFVHDWFAAEGIPITPIDDAMETNPFSLMRISATDPSSGSELGHLDVVVPVATETDCQGCHKTGAMAATGGGWSDDPDLEVQSKLNILKRHDDNHGTTLEADQPVLCAGCHYSRALDLNGAGPQGNQIGKPTFSNVMHAYHGSLSVGESPVFPSNGTVEQTCYQCHPGQITQCQRGAMKNGGMDCHACHGDMLSVGGGNPLLTGGSIDGSNDGNPRRPWLDLPRCQACHTGDAVSYLSGANLAADPDWPFRLRQAYQTGDAAASPLLAPNKRFAEETGSLYRFSRGHGNITCEGCHGSTHAIWPNADPTANDNQAAVALQGFGGPLITCTACHASGSLPRTVNGPHGLHTVNDALWYDEGHGDFYGRDKNSCKACHGTDLRGTPLSKVPTARRLSTEEGTVTYAKGDFVSCGDCHGRPGL